MNQQNKATARINLISDILEWSKNGGKCKYTCIYLKSKTSIGATTKYHWF